MLVLVDTSIWVHLLGRARLFQLRKDDWCQIVTCLPVIQEVFQGLREIPRKAELEESFLSLPRVADPMSLDYVLEAASLYRAGRKRGLTIRSSVDCLIAAIALKHKLRVWHHDRDFVSIAKYTALETFTGATLKGL